MQNNQPPTNLGPGERPVEVILAEYKEALAWVKSLISDINPKGRIYEYLKLLEDTNRANKTGAIHKCSSLLILDAHQQSNFLIELHKKFKD